MACRSLTIFWLPIARCADPTPAPFIQPGSEIDPRAATLGRGVTDVLLGDYAPTGKLPFS